MQARLCFSPAEVDRYTHSMEFRSNLTVLSLMQGVDGMPDPRTCRTHIAALLGRLEELEVDGT